jgi:hypothetical protein
VGEFDLEGVEEAFHWGVVVAATFPAHGRYCPHVGKLLSIDLRGVLAAAIRVTDEAGGRSLPLGGHHQGSRRQLGTHVIAHGPADDLAGREIKHGSQMKPALSRRQVGDVCQQTVLGRTAENCCFRRLGAIGRS